jgi:hypothetical protein
MTTVHGALDHRIFSKECRALARAGFDVTIVGPYSGDTTQEQVRIKSIPPSQSRFSRMTRAVWRVYRESRKLDPDVYHFHDPELIPAGLLLRAHGKRVVYDVHEDYPKDVLAKQYLPVWSRQFLAQIATAVEAAACKRFSAVVAVTPSIAKRFQPINGRTSVIYNYPDIEEQRWEQRVPWQQRRSAVAYIGTISHQRGIADIVGAMGLLPVSLPATLEIAGDTIPSNVTSLPGWCRVKYHGVLDRAGTCTLLREVRVGLSCQHPTPAFLESVPVKIFEYMAAGLPIIASDFPFWRRMLATVDCAIFVEPANLREISEAIQYLLTHPRQAEEMGQRGRYAVINEFNWNTQAGKLVNLYQDLVGHPCAA